MAQILLGLCILGAVNAHYESTYGASDLLLRQLMNNLDQAEPDYFDFAQNKILDNPNTIGRGISDRVVKDYDYPDLPSPMLRDQEYLEHSSLYGNQYIQGGAGKGDQKLKPDGSIHSHQEVKTDATLPAYCEPPNPCPVGYKEEDGCVEVFDNTAEFSRDYQASQQCMCDSEHMFECPSSSPGHNNNIPDLTETINTNAIDEFLQKIEGQHKSLVAKKFHVKKSMDKRSGQRNNPYLTGEMLPVHAKKGSWKKAKHPTM